MHKTTSSILTTLALALAMALVAAACGGSDSPDESMMTDAVATYTAGVHASYQASLDSARSLDDAIDSFIAAPTDESLAVAKTAWLDARDDYGPTEAFRFYGGPIDDEETGTEGLINAWPLDEAYIDYVVDASGALDETGVVNDPAAYPAIDAELLVSLNEQGGEANISTGWHAIEFLLWGQDLDETGPGARPVEDYTTNPNADRRAAYLGVATDLLITHLEDLEAAWAPGEANYRADFEALRPEAALRLMVTGIGELSRGELAGERMNVAYSERSQEDEHSCFSDNTTNDIIGNAKGIEMVLTGQYPAGVSGTGVLDLVAEVDSELSEQLRGELAATMSALQAIPAPFDQHLVDGLSDDDPGRAAVLTGIESLEDQTETIVAAASAIGVTINVS